jgi:copper chaperone CopZ
MKKLLLLLAFATLLAFTACSEDIITNNGDNGDNGAQTTAPPTETSESGETSETPLDTTTTLIVGGMTCSRCVGVIRREVSAVDGVIDVSVDLDSGEVVIEHESDVNIESVKNAIIGEGFTVE